MEIRRKVCRICKEEKDENLFVPIYKKKKDNSMTYRNECKVCFNKMRERARQLNPTEARIKANKKRWSTKRLKKYGISSETYNGLSESQNEKCKICGGDNSHIRRSLAIDHNHDTGEIRGLLCNRCNTTLGHIKEDIQLLENMIAYIKEYSK